MFFDTYLFTTINSLSSRFSWLDGLGIFGAQYLPYLLSLAVIYLLFKLPSWQEKYYFFILSVSSILISWGVISNLIHYFYHRLRPFNVLENINSLVAPGDVFSFPSNHLIILTSLAVSVWLFSRRWGIAFIFLTLLVGLSRIFVGVHWPTDIIVSIALGIIVPLLLKPLILPKSKPDNEPLFSSEI